MVRHFMFLRQNVTIRFRLCAMCQLARTVKYDNTRQQQQSRDILVTTGHKGCYTGAATLELGGGERKVQQKQQPSEGDKT
jgi:hypothetical protein